MITFGSVCSGIEAASRAWHPLGWRAEWFAEIEKFPAAVLAYHYPQVPNLGDMTKIAYMVRSGEVEAPDALVGGTPCQAFSLAGLRNSMADARGQLTLSYVDLANAIDSARHIRGTPPCVIVWENVPGVLSTSDNAFGCFLAALAGEDRELLPPRDDRGRLLSWPNAGCVFGPQRTIAWRVLDAQYFGVAQRRRRVFVVASARKGFDPTTVLFEFDGVRRDSAPSRETGQDLAGALASRTDGGGFPGTDEACSGYVQPVAGTLDASYGRLQGCSGQDANHGHSHLVPSLARCDTAGEGRRQDYETCTLVPSLSVALRGRVGGSTAELGDEVAGCLRASTGGGDKPHVLTPIAFDSRQDPVSNTDVFGALGAATPQAQSIAYSIRTANTSSNGWGIQEDVLHTLDCTAGPAVCVASEITSNPNVPSFAFAQNTRDEVRLINGDGELVGALAAQPGMKQTTYVAPGGMAVRRLTPVECERLQSFPDGYTSIPTWNGWRAMGEGETPEGCIADGLEVRQNKKTGKWRVKDVDGPRYKALGNSMCVFNMRWIGARVDAQLRALEAA